MDGDITMSCAETGTQVYLLVILTNCSVYLSFHAEPVRDYRTGEGPGSPPPKSNGYIFLYRGFIGGRGIAHPPSSSHPRCVLQHCRRVLRRRKDWHLSSSMPSHSVQHHTNAEGFPIGNAYSYTVKKGCSYLCMWMTSNWLERNKILIRCEKYSTKKLIWENQHN